MQAAFLALTSGITFGKQKLKSSDEAIAREKSFVDSSGPLKGTKDAPVAVNTNDPHEAANIVRKQLKIKVQGLDVTAPIQDFTQFSKALAPGLGLALTLEDYEKPTPVQAQVLPLLTEHRDVIAISPTGSGKTLAFLLPILNEAAHSKTHRSGIFAIILVPSRELAQQIQRVAARLCNNGPLRTIVLTKATATGDDFTQVDVVVTTPLRLCRLLKLRQLPLESAAFLVLDEADKLLQEREDEASFLKQIDTIVAACQQRNNRLTISIFSAIIPEEVERLVRTIQKDVVRVTVGSRNATASSVQQQLQFVGSEDGKLLKLQSLLSTGIEAPVLIFVSSSEAAVMLQKRLSAQELAVETIYASQDYASRSTALSAFRSGKVWILVASDVLSRGIDFIGVKTVINYDCPKSLQDYVHRIGRTGRASKKGSAITFFTEHDAALVRPIANLIVEAGQEVPKWMLLKGHEPKPATHTSKKRKRKSAKTQD